MNSQHKISRNKLLTQNKNPVNNYINKQKFRLGRLKSQNNIEQLNRLDINSLNNKYTPINPSLSKNILFKKTMRKISKRSIEEILNKNKSSLNKKINFINNKTTKYSKRMLHNKGIFIEQGNDVGRTVLTNTLYDDIKIRNIINLWNELDVNESYRKYFFFIYKELSDEDKSNFYSNEINELIQLKNDIKNLTYNIELRIGIIQKLTELNEELNKEDEKGEVNKSIINEMEKKLEDLTIQTINIVQYMKIIKGVINIIPNLGKYDFVNIAQKFDFDKNYIIKMKFETDFLKKGSAKKYFNIKSDQSPFIVKTADKEQFLLSNDQGTKMILLEEKILKEMTDCNYFIYKELISYETEKANKKNVRKISPIRKNSSAYNFYTNINFFTTKFIKKQEGIKEKLLFQLNPNKKEIKNNNSAMNIKKDSFIDKKFNNSERIVQTTDFPNYDNSNINKNTKIFNFKEKKNQIYIKKINTKNNNYINFHKKYSKNKLINPIINDSEMTSPKKIEDLKIKEKIESPNIDEKPLNNIIEESKDNKND